MADINGVKRTYANKDEYDWEGGEVDDGTSYMESEEYAKEHDDQNLQSSVVNTLQTLGMNVLTEKDLPYLIKHGITLAMMMGDEPLPEKFLKHLQDTQNG